MAQSDVKHTIDDVPRPVKKLIFTATSAGDSVILRWAPTDPVDWKLSNSNGYILERTTLGPDNKVEVRFEKLTKAPIKPWNKDFFIQNVSATNKRDKYCAIAAQALYGASFKPVSEKNNPPDLNEFKMLVKQNEEDRMRHSFALFVADVDAKAAGALGLRYVDKDVVKNKKYVYRLYAVPGEKLMQLDTVLFVISPKDVYPINRVTFVKANTHNKEVFLEWPKNGVENDFTAFFVERSADDGNTFKQLNEDPFINLNGTAQDLNNTFITFADTVPLLNKKYLYRVRGINSFAQYSPYSLPVSVTAKNDNPPARPEMGKTIKLTQTSNKITWRDINNTSAIKGFFVGRNNRPDSNYQLLNSNILVPGLTEFTDTLAAPGQSYYYNVTVVDTSGKSSTSVPDFVYRPDSVAPAPPTGLAGVVDTSGLVTLRWRLGPEEDIKGYRIYKANAADHIFTPVSKDIIQDTSFTDTIVLKTLTRDIYYKVMAVDNNLNNSGYSTALQLIKPDVVPPVPAVFVNYVTSDTSIQLFWNPSSSADLNKQHLYRKTGTGGWLQLALLDKTTASYNDTAVQKLTLYTYLLISEDSAGLKSDSSFPISAKTFFNAASGAGKITAEYLADSLVVKIGWQLPVNASATNIVLYRSVNGSSPVMYQNIPAGQQGYIDRQVAAGNTYGYSFKPIYAANREGGLSNTATVKP